MEEKRVERVMTARAFYRTGGQPVARPERPHQERHCVLGLPQLPRRHSRYGVTRKRCHTNPLAHLGRGPRPLLREGTRRGVPTVINSRR